MCEVTRMEIDLGGGCLRQEQWQSSYHWNGWCCLDGLRWSFAPHLSPLDRKFPMLLSSQSLILMSYSATETEVPHDSAFNMSPTFVCCYLLFPSDTKSIIPPRPTLL
jgi:hypothetical protein